MRRDWRRAVYPPQTHLMAIRPRPVLASTALISIVLAACSGDSDDALASSSWERTDSAGVEIIYTDFLGADP